MNIGTLVGNVNIAGSRGTEGVISLTLMYDRVRKRKRHRVGSRYLTGLFESFCFLEVVSEKGSWQNGDAKKVVRMLYYNSGKEDHQQMWGIISCPAPKN